MQHKEPKTLRSKNVDCPFAPALPQLCPSSVPLFKYCSINNTDPTLRFSEQQHVRCSVITKEYRRQRRRKSGPGAAVPPAGAPPSPHQSQSVSPNGNVPASSRQGANRGGETGGQGSSGSSSCSIVNDQEREQPQPQTGSV